MVGFFSFLLLLCCESATASFRASLVPIHSTFGISTFVLAVAAACSGLTEKAFFSLRYVAHSSSSISSYPGPDAGDDGMMISTVPLKFFFCTNLIPPVLAI